MKRACKPRGIDEPDPRAYSTGPGSFIMMRTVLHSVDRNLKGARVRVLKRALAIVYLAAAIVALGTLVCQFWGPYTYRFMLLLRDTMPRVVVTVCAAIVALGVLIGFFRLMFARREPSCVHPWFICGRPIFFTRRPTPITRFSIRWSAISRSRLQRFPRAPVPRRSAMIA